MTLDQVLDWDSHKNVAGLNRSMAGADPGFQVRGAHLKILRRAEGGAKNFGVFRVKNLYSPLNGIPP
jgi:hypothetical protein